MKKIHLCALIICASISLSAQTVSFKTSPCAENLLESYRRLSARIGVKTCVDKIPSVTGYMQAGCYSGQKDSGHVTFASFFDERAGSSFFRTTWDSEPLGYNYYGACYPSVIVWDVPHDGSTLNHVYEAYLLSTTDYQKSLIKTYAYLKKYAIKSDQIAQIISWGYERDNGWIATKENANYNNLNSSKGLIVTIKTKKGITTNCYLLNNYDGAATLTWKTAMAGTVHLLAEKEETSSVQVKLSSAVLLQNQPNPANNNTTISYVLPEKYINAKIRITDYTGNVIKEIKITGAGNGNINADVHSLNSGTYKYSLFVDGVMLDTKTMIVVK